MPVSYTRESPAWTDGAGGANSVVTASDAERWEQLGADTAAWSSQADAGIHHRIMLPGRWYTAYLPFPETNATIALTAGTVEMLPFLVSQTTSFDMIGCNVGTAVASSVIRLGVYRMDATTNEPGALVHDQGTTDSSTTGDKQLTISGGITLTPGMYYLAMVSGHAPAVRRTAGTLQARGNFAMYGATGVDNHEGFSLRYTGYTATSAYPNPATRAGRATRAVDIPLVWLRRSP